MLLNLIFDYTFVNSQYLFHFEHLVIGKVGHIWIDTWNNLKPDTVPLL